MVTDSIDDLGSFLQERLSASTELPVYLHILSDPGIAQKKGPEHKYSSVQWKHEQLYRKRLLLIFQKRGNRSVLVIGASVSEYFHTETKRLSRAYIQYVDTTGLFAPRKMQSHLTRSVVCSYLEYCQSVLKISKVHLLACSKPSFLFAGSEFNENKGRLSTAKLVKWWFSLIESAGLADAKVQVWSPGEDLMEDTRTRERIERKEGKNGQNSWHYGPFFEHNDRVVDVVPLFEDDPMLKHFMSFFEDCKFDSVKMDAVKTKHFMETLGLRPEFRNQCHSTFIIIAFESNQNCGLAVTASEQSTQLVAFATKMLGNLTFEDESKAIDSSGKITSWLKFMGSKPIHLRLVEYKEDSYKFDSKDENSANENRTINIQGLIKKRKIDQ